MFLSGKYRLNMPQSKEAAKIHNEESTRLVFNFRHSQAWAWEREVSLTLYILRDLVPSWQKKN